MRAAMDVPPTMAALASVAPPAHWRAASHGPCLALPRDPAGGVAPWRARFLALGPSRRRSVGGSA